MALLDGPSCKLESGREAGSRPSSLPLSRRAALARGALALTATCAAAACSPPRRTVVAAAPVRRTDSALDHLREGGPQLVVAGERLDTELLRQFYARRGFQPVWNTRPAQANALLNTVMRAGDHGMDPELFQASLLQRRASFPTSRRELLTSHAVLSYANALATGAVPVDRRKDSEALAPEPTDVAAVLDAVIDHPDPVAAIEALAPTTPTYQALRQALRRHRTAAPARGRPVVNRLRDIEVNLERQRWLPRSLPPDRVWVNVADQQLTLYRASRPVFSTRVIVGDEVERSQSPEFRATIEASFYNPPWIIPRDIVEEEILPRLSRDPGYLARNNMVLRDNGEVEQMPGPTAGLGLIMFDMPNRFDVYLHDTPEKFLFNRGNRRISHGCIRVQNPIELAALLLQQPRDAVSHGIAQGGTTRHPLPTPVPVFVIYQTAFADSAGAVQFRPDFYNRDADLWRRLRRQAQA